MIARSQPSTNLNELNPGNTIFKDENAKLFLLFKSICEIVADAIKEKKIIGTEDSVQKILFDIARNFYDYIKALSWYTTYESKIYCSEFYNQYYRDEIIKETAYAKNFYIEELDDLKSFTNKNIKEFITKLKKKDEEYIKGLIDDNENKDYNRTSVDSLSLDGYISKDDIKNKKLNIYRKIYILTYTEKDKILLDIDKSETLENGLLEKCIILNEVNGKKIYYLYIRFKKYLNYRKELFKGELLSNPFILGTKGKDTLLRMGKEISIEELKNDSN